MKTGRFSITTLLLVTAILAMAVHIHLQSKRLVELRTQNSQHCEELGKFDEDHSGSILVRPLLTRGPNTWRYRIYRKGGGFRYGFGVVDVNRSGSLILPPARNRRFHWMPSKLDGELELVLSIARSDNDMDWYYVVSEHPTYGVVNSGGAARLNKVSFGRESAVWNFKPPVTVVNELANMMTNGKTNGQVSNFQSNDTVVLFRSESPVQAREPHQAFVVVMQQTPVDE